MKYSMSKLRRAQLRTKHKSATDCSYKELTPNVYTLVDIVIFKFRLLRSAYDFFLVNGCNIQSREPLEKENCYRLKRVLRKRELLSATG